MTGQQVLYSKDENTNPLPGLIDGIRYWVRKVDDNTIELYDLEANAIAATSITQGRKDLTNVSPDDKLHELTTGNVMVDDNHIYVNNHQFTTGDGVIYRQGKMGVSVVLLMALHTSFIKKVITGLDLHHLLLTQHKKMHQVLIIQ